nr:MAG TPA: hypothetical protein [Caudoviricetes sp.]DAZ50564.1 MAG TPA: hypothetical protein [Caudoviricetes sp.]
MKLDSQKRHMIQIYLPTFKLSHLTNSVFSIFS